MVLAALTRVLEGMGTATALTSFLALACLLYPEDISTIYKSRTLGTALGFTCGIAIGLSAYNLLGYPGLFFSLGSLLMAGVALPLCMRRDDRVLSQAPRDQAQLSYAQVFRVRRVWVSLLMNCVSGFFSRCFEPTLALKLSQDFGFPPSRVFAYVCLYTISYALCALLFLCLPKHWEKRHFASLGTLLSLIAIALAGPSLALGLPDKP